MDTSMGMLYDYVVSVCEQVRPTFAMLRVTTFTVCVPRVFFFFWEVSVGAKERTCCN
jgi:hypothetical protein